MKKIRKWLTFLPLVIAAAVLAVQPAAAMAQSEDETAVNPDYPLKGSLAIVAPGIAGENQEISMRVFFRWDQEPLEGAGIWAFTRDQATLMEEEMKKMAGDESTSPEDRDYKALADIHGTFIGVTGADGRLYYTFGDSGTYLLVAIKKGYYPGLTRIRIGTRPEALQLDAPETAAVNEDVTMTVTLRSTGDVVEGAGIWSLTKERAESLKAEMDMLNEAQNDIDYESLMDIYGEYLGRTDERGHLTHAFPEGGGYMLVTVKRGYLPARSVIRVGDVLPQALVLRAPGTAAAGEEVLMNVCLRRTQEPVQGAGIWAVSRENIESFQADMTALRENAAVSAADTDYDSLMNLYGEFLGRTDDQGNLGHVFTETGGYLLVAVKQGCFPAWSPIRIYGEPELSARQDSVKNRTTAANATGLRLIPNRLRQAVSDTM
jgi:hypothetical protein